MRTIGLYLTQSGKEAIRLTEYSTRRGVSYGWTGEYGAGSGQSLNDYLKMIQHFRHSKRGMRVVVDAHAYAAEIESSAIPRTMQELYVLWADFGEVSTDEDDLIEVPFAHFSRGTHRENVWHWFEARNPHFLVGEAQSGIRRSEDGTIVDAVERQRG